jgi:hypothetical protein
LPSVCNGLGLEFVILHGICHIWACSPSILNGISYIVLATSGQSRMKESNTSSCQPQLMYLRAWI